MEVPSEERRTFLEVHYEGADAAAGPRLLQLEPHTRFANVFLLLGSGALYWGNRLVVQDDTPGRLRMPRGVDHPVALSFEPAPALHACATTNCTAEAREEEEEEEEERAAVGGDLLFDPLRQPIPEVLPARFSTGHRGAGDGDGRGARPRLVSPSLSRPPPQRLAGEPGAGPGAAAWGWRAAPLAEERKGHYYYDGRGLPVPLPSQFESVFSHRSAPPLREGGLSLPSPRHPYGGGGLPVCGAAPAHRPGNNAIRSPPTTTLLDERRGHRRRHSRHRRIKERRRESSPPPSANGLFLSLEKEIGELRREVQQLRRERAGETSAREEGGGRGGGGDLVQSPSTRPLERAMSIDVEELAEELHLKQMRRLVALRALQGGAIAANQA